MSMDAVRFRSHRASMVEAMIPSGESAENAMVSLVGLFVVVVMCAADCLVCAAFCARAKKKVRFCVIF